MAFVFADSFDCYAATADAINGYWDSGTTGALTIQTGRFAGSQSVQNTAAAGQTLLVKSSAVNDAVHHLAVSFYQASAISGASLAVYLQLLDGTTAQCSVVFRSDGAILLTSGGPAGTVLATYAGAFTVAATWYAFEFEIVVHNSTGSFKVRKNGNTSDDHSTTGIDTAGGTANNYANKLQVGTGAGGTGATQRLDDLFWRSDASSVAWMGDLRCFTRMPASDASVQFSRTPTSNTQTVAALSTSATVGGGVARYAPFTAAYDGTIGAATITINTGYTGNIKCSIFASSGSAPTTVLGSATVLTNPVTGSNAITFGTPVTVAKGTQYWIGFDSDASGSWNQAAGTTGGQSTTAYASFPVASPTISSAVAAPTSSVTIAVSTNNSVVNEAQQDTTTSYVYDSTTGHADFYNIGAIASTPSSIIACTTRGYMQKSDAGSRTAAVQLKSGGTTVASPTLTLTTSGWQWAWRTDITDPATGTAWTAAAVNAAQIGPTTVS